MDFKHILYIQDRSGKTIDTVSSHYDDKHVMDILLGSSSYEFSLDKTDDAFKYIEIGNFVVFQDFKKNAWAFTITNIEETHDSYAIYCENLGLELLNKAINKWEINEAHTFEYFFNLCTDKTGWEIGVNEIKSLSRKVNYEGRQSALARILSLLNTFDDAEIDFQIEMKNTKIVRKVANIYKKRGNERSDINLVYNVDVNDIRKTTSMDEFVTALCGVGQTEENEDLYFRDIEYDDGDFFTQKGEAYVRSRNANNQFNIKTFWAEDFYEYQTSSQQELFNRTLSQLKKRCEPAVNYEVDLTHVDTSLNLGDYVKIIDHDYSPALYLKARVLSLTISYKDPKNNFANFGNYLILQSNINQKLKDLQNAVNSLKVGSSFIWIRYADDDKGNGMSAIPSGKAYIAFKPMINQPIPSDNPADYEGLWTLIQGENGLPGQKGEDGITYYTWLKYADNVSGGGMSDSPIGKAYIGLATNKNTEIESTNPSDYVWSLIKGSDGENGKPTYTWVKYGDSPTTGMSDNPANKKYIGFAYNKLTSTESTSYADYSWSLIKGSDGAPGIDGTNGITTYTWYRYADNSSGAGITANPVGKKYIGLAFNKTTSTASNIPGDYNWSAMYDEKKITDLEGKVNALTFPVTSPSEPTNPVEGQQWWKVNLEGDVIGFFVYRKALNPSWQPQTIQQSILNIVELNAVKITGSEITGTVLTGSSILNSFDANFNGANLVGISKLEGGVVRIDYSIKGTTQMGYVEMNPLSISGTMLNEDGTTALNGFELSSSGLFLKNGDKTSMLSASDLYDSNWVTCPIKNGYNASVSVRRKFGITSVDLWVNTDKFGSAATNVVAVIPEGFRPYKDFSTIVGTNSLVGTGVIRFKTNGEILIWSGLAKASHSGIITYPMLN